MCEPSHSIVQYEDPTDKFNDDDSSASAQSGSYNFGTFTGHISKWAKKIRNWFHFSAMGSGHSEALGSRGVGYTADQLFILYEANWWNRTVKPDGYRGKYAYFQPDRLTKDEMEKSAIQYANSVSIGDLTKLRNFLETSMLLTDNPVRYVYQFHDGILNDQGKTEFRRNFQKFFKSKFSAAKFLKTISSKKQSIIDFTIGFTRKRTLLVPEWADDTKLWTPDPSII